MSASATLRRRPALHPILALLLGVCGLVVAADVPDGRIPLLRAGLCLVAEATVDGAPGGRFLIDTGRARSAVGREWAARRVAAGDRTPDMVRLRGFALGGMEPRDAGMVVMDLTGIRATVGLQQMDGIIGMDLLAGYGFWLDHRGRTLGLCARLAPAAPWSPGIPAPLLGGAPYAILAPEGGPALACILATGHPTTVRLPADADRTWPDLRAARFDSPERNDGGTLLRFAMDPRFAPADDPLVVHLSGDDGDRPHAAPGIVGMGLLARSLVAWDPESGGTLRLAPRDPEAVSPDHDEPDLIGWTDLMVAAATADTARITALVAHGARTDRAAADGATALHLAAATGDGATVEALLDAGADPRIRDGAGRTAGDLAGDLGLTVLALRLRCAEDWRRPAASAADLAARHGGDALAPPGSGP